MKRHEYDPLRAAKGAARKAHFAKGGTPQMWVGRADKFGDDRKEKARKACRGRYRDED